MSNNAKQLKILLDVNQLAYANSSYKILASNLTFQVGRGDCVLIRGANGVGKTTLLHTLLRFQNPVEGTIQWYVPNGSIGYLPQISHEEFHIPVSIRDVVCSDASYSDHWIVRLGLLGKEHLSLGWNSASGGEKRRALLTRILLREPSILILDEPFNHLDSESQEIVFEILRQINESQSIGLLIVSHEKQILEKLMRIKLIHLER